MSARGEGGESLGKPPICRVSPDPPRTRQERDTYETGTSQGTSLGQAAALNITAAYDFGLELSGLRSPAQAGGGGVRRKLIGLTQRMISWGRSRDGGELARGNRFVDTEGCCQSQVTLHSRLGPQRAAAGLPPRFSQRPGGLGGARFPRKGWFLGSGAHPNPSPSPPHPLHILPVSSP